MVFSVLYSLPLSYELGWECSQASVSVVPELVFTTPSLPHSPTALCPGSALPYGLKPLVLSEHRGPFIPSLAGREHSDLTPQRTFSPPLRALKAPRPLLQVLMAGETPGGMGTPPRIPLAIEMW